MDTVNAYEHVAALTRERNAALAALDHAYRERAELIALLTRSWPTVWADDADTPGWRVVYVSTPAGQASWHIAPQDWGLFAHVRHDPDVVWDGHSSEEKYDRLRRLTLLVDWVMWED